MAWTLLLRGPGGDTAAADVIRDAEHRGDAAKRALLRALRAAFVTPMEPEDVFARVSDFRLGACKDAVIAATRKLAPSRP